MYLWSLVYKCTRHPCPELVTLALYRYLRDVFWNTDFMHLKGGLVNLLLGQQFPTIMALLNHICVAPSESGMTPSLVPL